MTENPAPEWRSPITTPGVYMDIPMDRYHGEEICPGPSVSSSGLRTIEQSCPYLYWWNSPLNPQRPQQEEKAHFSRGRLLHELCAEGDKAWSVWHITPDGYSPHHVKKWEGAIAEAEAAVAAGKQLISFGDAQRAQGMADAIMRHPRAKLLFQKGLFEPTLAWKDEETGLWLRVRPDFLPDVRAWIPDIKSTLSAHPDDFSRSMVKYGYHMAAALYLEGIRVLYGGERPKGFMLVAQESKEPYLTEIYQVDEEAIGYGEVLNRRAMRKLADCLAKDRWPQYGNEINLVSVPDWDRKKLEFEIKAGSLDVPSHS